jgi:uncharacterized protein (TIGR02757 family)
LNLKDKLDTEVNNRNKKEELCIENRPDPLIIAKRYNDEYISLICALFAYGKASLIVKFLDSLDFNLLDKSEEEIKEKLQNYYYRFQTTKDVIAFFIALKRLKEKSTLNELFLNGYNKNRDVLEGIEYLIQSILEVNDYNSQGYNFLIGKPPKRDKNNQIKQIGNAPYKRWNMFLRWMVRHDELDMGLWTGVDKSDLILPLDTHTFNVSKNLGLLSRKTYDLKSALLITEKLKEFDSNDPIKYDFALYRLGQEKLL